MWASESSFSHRMYINARIENQNLIPLVDTGASDLALISKTFAQRLKLLAKTTA